MEEKSKPKFIQYLKYLELIIIGIIALEMLIISIINPKVVDLFVPNSIISYFTIYISSLFLLVVMLIRLVANLTLYKSIDKAFLSNNFKVLLGVMGVTTALYLISTMFSNTSGLGFMGYYTNLGPNATLWFSFLVISTGIFVNTYREKEIQKHISNIITYTLSVTQAVILVIAVVNAITLETFSIQNLKDNFSIDTNFILLIALSSFIFSFAKFFNSKKDLEKYLAITTIVMSSILFTIFSYQFTIVAFILMFTAFLIVLRKQGSLRNSVLLAMIVLTGVQFLTLFTDLKVFKNSTINLPLQESIVVTADSIQHNPITGAGANSFLNSFWKYRSVEFNNTPLFDQSFDKPGSEAILFVHDLGIPGLILIIILGFLLVRTLFSTKESDHFTDGNKYLVLTFGLCALFVFTSASLLGYLFLVAFLSMFLSNADDYFKRQNIVNFSTNTVVETIPPEKNINSSLSMILNSIIIIGIFGISIILFDQFGFARKYISNEATLNYTRSQFRDENIDTQTLNSIVNKQRELILDVNNIAGRGDYPNEYALMNISIAKLIIDNNNDVSELGDLIGTLIESAISGTNKAVELYPDSVEEWKTRGNIYASMSEFRGNSLDIAVNSFIKAAQISPNDPTLRLDLGKLYILSLQNEDAIEQLSKAVRLKSDMLEARALLIRVYSEEDRLIDAFDHIKYFIDNVSVDSEYYQQVADIIAKYQQQSQTPEEN